jgi:hypothetical protein
MSASELRDSRARIVFFFAELRSFAGNQRSRSVPNRFRWAQLWCDDITLIIHSLTLKPHLIDRSGSKGTYV